MLSAVNTAAADILRRSELGGGLALIFAIMYERHVLRRKSRWCAAPSTAVEARVLGDCVTVILLQSIVWGTACVRPPPVSIQPRRP